MTDKKCIRCYREMRVLDDEFNDAEDYSDWLLEEGIVPEPGDVLCEECFEEMAS